MDHLDPGPDTGPKRRATLRLGGASLTATARRSCRTRHHAGCAGEGAR
ncbi:DUF6380 family protein [Streptomyces sp. NPDC057877]